VDNSNIYKIEVHIFEDNIVSSLSAKQTRRVAIIR